MRTDKHSLADHVGAIQYSLRTGTWLLALVALMLSACGGGGGDGEEESSSSQSVSSSSSFSDREDIAYDDTLLVDSLYRIGLSDSGAGSWVLYIENTTGAPFKAGTRFTVWAGTQNLTGVRLRIRKEGAVKPLVPSDAVNGVYTDYMEPHADTTDLVGNDFYTTEAGYYALEIEATPGTSPAYLKIHVMVDDGLFGYTGTGDTIDVVAGDTLRGFFRLDQGEGAVVARFRSPAGYRLGLSVQGSLTDTLWVADSLAKALSASGITVLKAQYLPQLANTWYLNMRSVQPSYLDGPYAFFTVALSSMQLLRGEYFAWPDSIAKPGDTLTVVRPRNDAALYDVRHDQYVWLGDLAAGDSILVRHDNEGFTSVKAPVLAVLNSKGDSVGVLNASNNFAFKAPSAGAWYLHYYRTDGYATDPALTLTLTTVVQKPGSLQGWSLDKSFVNLNLSDSDTGNDTLKVAQSLIWTPTPATGSTSVQWYLTCEDLVAGVVSDGRSTTSCAGTRTLLQNPWLVARKTGSAKLISQSVADPNQADTLLVQVQ